MRYSEIKNGLKTPCVGGGHWRTGRHLRKYSPTATDHHGLSPHPPARLLFHARTNPCIHPTHSSPAPSSQQCTTSSATSPLYPSPHPHRRQSSLPPWFNIHFECKATCMSTTAHTAGDFHSRLRLRNDGSGTWVVSYLVDKEGDFR